MPRKGEGRGDEGAVAGIRTKEEQLNGGRWGIEFLNPAVGEYGIRGENGLLVENIGGFHNACRTILFLQDPFTPNQTHAAVFPVVQMKTEDEFVFRLRFS